MPPTPPPLRRRRLLLLTTLLLGGLAAWLQQPTAAAVGGPLLVTVAGDPHPADIPFPAAAVVDAAPARVAPRLLPDGAAAVTLQLRLFDLPPLTADLHAAGAGIWQGNIRGRPHSQVTALRSGNQLTLHAVVDGIHYMLAPAQDGSHVLVALARAPFAIPDEPLPIRAAATPQPQPPAGGPVDQTLLVVYTPAAAAAAGDAAALRAWIRLGVAESNLGYQQSGIDLTLTLLDALPVDYAQSGDLTIDLYALQAPDDGPLDRVHAWREATQADMVLLVVDYPLQRGCGQAFLMEIVTPAFAPWAFGIVNRPCISPNYSLAHELGHIQSARHDWRVDPTADSPFSHNHGYVDPGDLWRTIMAYDVDCDGCGRINYWSNPDLDHPFTGAPLGVADGRPHAADNRLTLTKTAPTVAGFRSGAVYRQLLPAAPLR